jgi:hypothetical protein
MNIQTPSYRLPNNPFEALEIEDPPSKSSTDQISPAEVHDLPSHADLPNNDSFLYIQRILMKSWK